jgi:tRNA A64-2'-O-ribosylphosphate transferase
MKTLLLIPSRTGFPLRCCVINRAISRLRKQDTLEYPDSLEEDQWDNKLYTPPHVVSPQEKARIEEKLDGWVSELIVSV